MISDERLEKALSFMATTDTRTARYLGLYRGLEDQTKSILAMCYAEAVGDTVKDREMSALRDERYLDHLIKIQNARTNYEILRLKRSTEERVIEVWRSLNANARRGNI